MFAKRLVVLLNLFFAFFLLNGCTESVGDVAGSDSSSGVLDTGGSTEQGGTELGQGACLINSE